MKLSAEQQLAVMADARYSDIGAIPSNYRPYESHYLGDRAFNKLLARPFERAELSLLSKAIALRDDTHLYRAVDLCINQDVNDLTQFDFFYVLLWLRVNSFPRQPYSVPYTCKANIAVNPATNEILLNDRSNWPENPDDLDLYTKVEVCDKENVAIVHTAVLNYIQLDETDEYQYLPADFDYPRVRTLIEEESALDDPELVMLLPAVRWIKGNTLSEKLARLDADSGAFLSMFGEAKELADEHVHGYLETVSVSCPHCRAKHNLNIQMEARSFFQ